MHHFRDIKSVEVVATYGSINRAAGVLGLSQPALTKRIQALEEQLGLTLFQRLPRGVALTPGGEVFLSEGRKLLVHADDFQARLTQHSLGDAGQVRVGVKPGLNDVFLQRTLARFSREFPNAHIDIVTGATPQLADCVLSGRIDFAFGAEGYLISRGEDSTCSDGLEFEPMFQFPFMIVVRAEHPVLRAADPHIEIAKYPIICPTPPDQIVENLHNVAMENGQIFNGPHIQMDDYTVLLDLVAQSNSWTAIFAANRADLTKDGRFEFLINPDLLPAMTVGLITRSSWIPTPSAKNFIDAASTVGEAWHLEGVTAG